ncbi:hypothetical protein [Spirosoma spitsbergense]|uniref:hypothetical protein n=1 Tax=Spirosoma spitsbergense TaxID=431554 RepID=UPI0003770C6D|nr:hypothetical protein [Spirosoma spitsbergense]
MAGSRHQALEECKNAGPGTVGAVIARILSSTALAWTVKYEVASGDIGSFYHRPEIKAILRSPWSDNNLRELSRRETLFYQTQSGVAGAIGQALSEDGRFYALRIARDHLF